MLPRAVRPGVFAGCSRTRDGEKKIKPERPAGRFSHLCLDDIFADSERQQCGVSGLLQAAGSRLGGPAALQRRACGVQTEAYRLGRLRRD